VILTQPPNSPVSWSRVNNAKHTGPLAVISGIRQSPTTLVAITFSDRRPYGDTSQREFLLARYERFLVLGVDDEKIVLPLNVAVDAATGEPVCAWTDPSPLWARAEYDLMTLPSVSTTTGTFPRPTGLSITLRLTTFSARQ